MAVSENWIKDPDFASSCCELEAPWASVNTKEDLPMRSVTFVGLFIVLLIGADIAHAQRTASPRGEAATEIGGEYEGRRYTGGKWVSVDYGRPILRGRTGIFGEGDAYGQTANAGAPLWRAGANKSTRFMTEADLTFGDHTLPAGEYSLFIDLKTDGWTLIFSNHTAKDNFRDSGDGLWGKIAKKIRSAVSKAFKRYPPKAK